ncbi:MAG: RNA pseudouridine synthase [Alphaproteobacteria bacterium]|nr:RNA pseudouridine synthase [Alphaproteobacteria bacterium]
MPDAVPGAVPGLDVPTKLGLMDLSQRVLYRDAMMMIIDKPAGLPVHSGPRGGVSLEDYFDGLRFGLRDRPELAHRLDSDTSGCLVLGRHRKALARLGQLFQSAKIEKTYWAVVTSVVPGPSVLNDAHISDSGDWHKITGFIEKISSKADGWTMRVCDGGQVGAKPAETWWRLRGKFSVPETSLPAQNLYWLELMPKTGRTHQLRVHCASLAAPILGDRQYGGESLGDFAAKMPKDMMTHAKYLPNWRGIGLVAKRITIPIYPNKPAVTVEAPLPEFLQSWFAACGWRPEKKVS